MADAAVPAGAAVPLIIYAVLIDHYIPSVAAGATEG